MAKSICDWRWQEHLKNGERLEEFTVGNYRVLAIKIGKEDNPNYLVNYHYRLLCFTSENEEPVLAYNLESSKINPERFFLCCHTPEQHINYGSAPENITYQEFKTWAVSVISKKIN